MQILGDTLPCLPRLKADLPFIINGNGLTFPRLLLIQIGQDKGQSEPCSETYGNTRDSWQISSEQFPLTTLVGKHIDNAFSWDEPTSQQCWFYDYLPATIRPANLLTRTTECRSLTGTFSVVSANLKIHSTAVIKSFFFKHKTHVDCCSNSVAVFIASHLFQSAS